MGEMQLPMNYSCLCPLCNQIFPAMRFEQLQGRCPYCGKSIGRSCIIYANTETQSFELAQALQYERTLSDNEEV